MRGRGRCMQFTAQYQRGFSTLENEIVIRQLPVQGTLPRWLSGTMLRNGPAKFEVGRHEFRHWFDGLAMLHRFTFANGSVSYANRYLLSPAYRKARETGRISYREFATDPNPSIMQRLYNLLTGVHTGDNASHNVARIADH